uniref:Dynein light chain roadblock-type 2 n=1 Tax=Cyprinus carpio carpio TaxID=630221 RepID=A0A8C1F4D3_CYPCA
ACCYDSCCPQARLSSCPRPSPLPPRRPCPSRSRCPDPPGCASAAACTAATDPLHRAWHTPPSVAALHHLRTTAAVTCSAPTEAPLLRARASSRDAIAQHSSGRHWLPKAEVEDTLKRIQGINGVIGTIVVNAEGIPIKSTLDNSTTVQYTGLLHQLTMKARSTVRDIDPQNDLMFLRIRSKKHEIMVSTDKEYLLIVIQNPAE